MKIWWVLAWDNYYPDGSLGNVKSTWGTKEEAIAEEKRLADPSSHGNGWYGADNIDIVNISDML